MNRLKYWLFYIVIALAILGLGNYLWTDPAAFIKNLIFIGVFAAIIIFLFTRFRGTAVHNRKEHKAFVKAAKYSKKRLKMRAEQKNNPINRSISKPSIKKAIHSKKRSAPHLTVIEGKKGKKKDKASL
ncbi:hypothetical protein SAMN05877753_102160 [Bacillus oleivorans]|uniref:Uncharacterized protein n=1 Tax=Bacillus oleivorans TaxID=1448271 RepID=A0A285CKR6_9BACI|nr:SA1362 family protein [Bacillus oleivorans]SNX67955.1 hypothetical protein SAMN05877753_102160 [Bacillus oleivorans]